MQHKKGQMHKSCQDDQRTPQAVTNIRQMKDCQDGKHMANTRPTLAALPAKVKRVARAPRFTRARASFCAATRAEEQIIK